MAGDEGRQVRRGGGEGDAAGEMGIEHGGLPDVLVFSHPVYRIQTRK